MPADAGPFYTALGRRIHKLRRQRGLTQEQLGARLAPQLTRASITNIEAGNQRVLAHTLWQIAEVLEVSSDELLQEKTIILDDEVRRRVESELNRLPLSQNSFESLARKLGVSKLSKEDPQ
jgi:transcriptional regulator with XRE-family HTH domain